MKDLDNLIYKLKKDIVKKSPYIKTIRNPALLVKSLIELNELIGNEKIKESIVLQISHIIINKQKSLYHQKKDDVMLNTVLAGPPGCGKTLIGTKLAKIWYALGYLNQPSRQTSLPIPEVFKHHQNEDTSFVIILGILFLIWIFGMTYNFYSNYGGLFTVLLVIVLIAVLFGIMFTMNQEDKPIKDHIKQVYHQPKINEDDMITVVSRAQFVAKFVGHSAQQTNKLLYDNIGKVLFVDEAYSLLQSMDDSFGMEALTSLNLFMSQHPNDIIIIFAGYQDLLEAGPFAAQPGLKRRFMWQFDCEGYNNQELFDILKLKLKKDWILEDEIAVRQLFDKYDGVFTAFGGDIEKMLFFASLEHSRDFINNDNLKLNILTTNQIERAILKLKENNVSRNENDSYENPMANLMNMFRSRRCPPKYKPKPSDETKTSIPTVEDLSFSECENLKNTLYNKHYC
jgi:hypothetical protein